MNEPTLLEMEDIENGKIMINIRKRIYFFIKRLFDFIMSLIGLIVLSPIFIIIGILIKIDSKGPVFFKHKRIGKNGKMIGVYKFRSMVINAEELKEKFTPEQKAEYEKNFKLDNDPRITRIGKILRKTSLDELPQLLNILFGSMSIVGPRPIVEKEIEKYGNKRDKFLSVTPGLTGFWQASGRSDIEYDERIKMELYYVDHCSLWLDFKIILKTVVAVIKREGAK